MTKVPMIQKPVHRFAEQNVGTSVMKGLTTVEKVRFRRFRNEFSRKHPTSETLGTLFYSKCSNKSKTSTFVTFENRRNAAMAKLKF